MVSGAVKDKPGENVQKTLVSKGGSAHSVSTTYTREEIKLLIEEYFMHKLKQ